MAGRTPARSKAPRTRSKSLERQTHARHIAAVDRLDLMPWWMQSGEEDETPAERYWRCLAGTRRPELYHEETAAEVHEIRHTTKRRAAEFQPYHKYWQGPMVHVIAEEST